MFSADEILTHLALLLSGLALFLGPLDVTTRLLPKEDACILQTSFDAGLDIGS